MATSNEIDFDFYYKRLAEFDSLLAGTKSKTLRDILQIAKDSTESSLEKFAKLQKMTVVILMAKKITTEQQLKQYTEHIKKATEQLEAGRFSSLEEFSTLNNGIRALGNRDKTVYELSLKVYGLAVKEFERTLLQLIFKPNNKSFHYESILDGLRYLAGQVFPGLDELGAIKKIVPSVRKKDFAKTSDKLMLYIEQYLDVLEKWNEFADTYIDVLDSCLALTSSNTFQLRAR